METLAFGYGLVEAPRVDGEGILFFADVIQGGVYRRTPGGTIDTIVPKRRGMGGLVLHVGFVTSLCFGGADRRDLAEDPTRGGTIFRTRVDVPGLIVPLARV